MSETSKRPDAHRGVTGEPLAADMTASDEDRGALVREFERIDVEAGSHLTRSALLGALADAALASRPQAAPSVSRPEADALPSWATALDHVCITAKCSGCGEHVSQFEDSGVAHFDSIEDALASVADDDDDADHVVIGDELLCRNCRDKRECERVGHDWVHHESFLGPYDSRTVPEFWTCSLCGHGSKTDPTLTHEVTP